MTTKKDLNTKDDKALVTTTKTDQRGQAAWTQRPDGSVVQHLSPVVVNADHAMYEAESNPYYATGYDPNGVFNSTQGWKRTKRDQLGRVVEVALYSGATMPSPWGSNASLIGTIGTLYDGYSKTVTDESGRTRQLTEDGIGRLKTVVEDPGTSPRLNYTTTYGYDFKDNLTSVNQSGQTRGFVYSSLGRLRSATNPESGTTTYRYDKNGNLLTKQDALLKTTTFGFDDLNRLAANSLRGTSPVTYCFDGDTGTHTVTRGAPAVNVSWSCSGAPSGSLLKLRRTMVSVDGGSVTKYKSYDELGRVTSSEQKTNGTPYPFLSYHFNLGDGLKSIQYPSGRSITYGHDAIGRVSTASSGATNYVTAVGYAPHGAMASLSVRNGAGYEETCFDARLRMSGVRLGTATTNGACTNPGNSDLLNISYSFAANGNVLSQTIVRQGQSWIDRYNDTDYDAVNRLMSASEGPNWSQAYAYDAWGNRAVAPWSAIPYPYATPTATSQYQNSNGVVDKNQWNGTGAGYDAAGNQTALTGGRTFTYDAENRLTATAQPNMDPISYAYDGDGRRVVKNVGSATTVYVYDAAGNLAAEYGAPTDSGTQYVTADALGSTRLTTDSSGTVKKCYDYYPFGEEIAAGVGGRGSCFPTIGYPTSAVDAVNTKFTGQPRDEETGMDLFGQRYFSSPQGRFTTPDYILAKMEWLDDPQRWNRYAYVRNNPLRFIDPNGEDLIVYYWDSQNLTSDQQKWLEKNRQKVLNAMRDRFTKAGI